MASGRSAQYDEASTPDLALVELARRPPLAEVDSALRDALWLPSAPGSTLVLADKAAAMAVLCGPSHVRAEVRTSARTCEQAVAQVSTTACDESVKTSTRTAAGLWDRMRGAAHELATFSTLTAQAGSCVGQKLPQLSPPSRSLSAAPQPKNRAPRALPHAAAIGFLTPQTSVPAVDVAASP